MHFPSKYSMTIWFAMVFAVCTSVSGLNFAELAHSLPVPSLVQLLDKAGQSTTSQGRRRQVYDVQCDNVIDGDDSIEDKCNSQRYGVFKSIRPGMMNTSYQDATNLGGLQKLNTSMGGDVVNLDGPVGIRPVFEKQRTYLYGINGTCTNPKPASLSGVTDSTTKDMFKFISDVEGVYDTHWSNLETIQDFLQKQFMNRTTVYSDEASTLLGMMNDGAKRITNFGALTGTDFVKNRNLNLTDQALRMNSNMRLVYGNLSAAASNNAHSQKMEADAVDSLLDRMDAIADLFGSSDGVVSDVIAALNSQAAPSVNLPPNRIANQSIQPIITRGNMVVTMFANASNNNVKQTDTTWGKTLQQAVVSQQNDNKKAWDSYETGSAKIDSAFDTTSSQMDANITYAVSNATKLLADAQKQSADAKSLSELLASSISATQQNVQSNLQSASGKSQDVVSLARSRLGTLLGSTSDGVNTQFGSLASSIGVMGSELNSKRSQVTGALQGRLGAVTGNIAQTGAIRSNAASDTLGSIQSQRRWGQNLAGSAGSYQNTAVTGTLNGLLDGAFTDSGNVYQMAVRQQGAVAAEQASATTALSGAQDGVEASTTATVLTSKRTARDLTDYVSGNASSVAEASQQSQSILSETGHELWNSNSQLSSAANGMYLSGQLGGAGTAGSAEQLGTITDNIASSFGQQLKSAVSGTSSQTSTVQDGVTSQISTSATNAMSGISALLDQLNSAARGDATVGFDYVQENLSGVGDGFSGTVTEASSAGSEISSKVQSALNVTSGGYLNDAGELAVRFAQSLTKSGGGVNGTLGSELEKSVNSFLSTAGQYVPALPALPSHADIVRNQAVIDEGEKKVIDAIAGARASIPADLIDSQRVSESDRVLQANWTAMQGSTEMGYSDFASQTNSLVSVLPGNFTTGIDGSLATILAQELDAANGINKGASVVGNAATAAATSSANASLVFLNSLDAATHTWQGEYDASHEAAFSTSQDRVNRLSDMADSASGIARDIEGLQKNGSSQSGLFGYSQADMQAMVKGLGNAVGVSQGTLSRGLSSAEMQAQFGAQMDMSQAGQLMSGFGTETVAQTVGDMSSASDALASQGQIDISSMEYQLSVDDQNRQNKIRTAAIQLGANRNATAVGISENASDRDVQLMMAQRAVGKLLGAWDTYVTAETDKFKRMSGVDVQYTQMTANAIQSSRDISGTKLRDGGKLLASTESSIGDAVAQFVQFRNATESTLATLAEIIPLTESTTRASYQQIGESVAAFDRSDARADASVRNETLGAIAQFEAGLDEHARMALAAARGSLDPALAGG